MSLILVIAGLILLLAGSGWFAGAATVGIILLVVGGVLFTIQTIWTLIVASKVNKGFKQFDRF